ncbi:MAG: prephenate dehydrogenase/arogenate dehydrogenase family protein [Fibrobacterales bacterium]
MKNGSSEKTIVIVGLGLLGSSIALNLKHQNSKSSFYKVIGISRDVTIAKATDQKLIDEGYTYDQLSEWKSKADLIILCTPITHIMNFMKTLAEDSTPFKSGAIITDVGSTKKELCELGQKLYPKSSNSALFIGSHPMAGSEKTGIDAQESTLYENSYWILCPPSATDPSEYSLLTTIVEALGSHIVTINAAEHDAVMGRLSHSVQIISSALAHSFGNQTAVSQDSLQLAGRAFRDMTRIAASGYSMWESIFKTNRTETVAALEGFQQSLADFKACLESDEIDKSKLESLFSLGADVRSHVSNPGKGFSHGLCELIVTMEDQPGMIASIVTPLSSAGINIRDIELLKVREGVGGTLLLGFDTQNEATEAQELLLGKNITSRLR